MEDAARLLKEAELLYERHQAGRRDPFNVFTALRSPSDEVNLHSRFLHALLDHRKPGEDGRANLEDFITEFWPTKHMPGFASDDTKVERERHNIDILITNRSGQDFAIENKIYAEDQDRQIERYYKELKGKGYKDAHVLYLTIDDHDPSERSTGDLDKEKYTPIAYGEVTFLQWLGRCQKRAYDEPELRESIAQYLHLIKKMTGNDQGSEYMNEMKNLLSQGNNLLIVHDLEKVTIDARAHIMSLGWEKIKYALKENPNSLGDTQGPSDITEDRIKAAIKRRGGEERRLFGWFGLYYSLRIEGIENALLGIEASRGEGFIAGVRCHEQYEQEYKKIHGMFKDSGGESREWWPWFRIVRDNGTGLNPDDLEALLREIDWNALAKDCLQTLNYIRGRLSKG